MFVSAKTDYAVRLLTLLARQRGGIRLRAAALARSDGMPIHYIEAILVDLRRRGLLTMRRGPDGGYQLARPASEITIGEIFAFFDGRHLEVHGLPANEVPYGAKFAPLKDLWIGLGETVAAYLGSVTVGDLVATRDSRKPIASDAH